MATIATLTSDENGANSLIDINNNFANLNTDKAENSAVALKAPLASPTFTGTVTIPTPFTLGAVSVTPTGTELNFVDGVTSAIQTQLDSKAPTASPTFTGTVTLPRTNFGANTAYFTETDNGNSSTADTIDWTLSNKQKSTLTGNCTFTFTAPPGPCTLTLKLVQDGTGSRTVTWPAAVHWPAGVAPTLTTTASRVDIISFYYDGTTYFGASSLNYVA